MAKKVVIDPGHGGEDPGASANGIVEKDYTLLISKYMADRLTELGIDNALTRDSDVTLDSTTRPKTAQSLFGTGNDVILVSNHINAGGGDGAEIIYALRNSDNLSSKIASEFIKSGQNVRKYYQRRLPSNSSKDYYYMLRETPNNESIIVEYGFLDSTGDDVSQIKNNWQNLAEAVVRALADYIGVAYIPPEGLEEIDDNIYIVKKGDTLYGIANKYGISVDELKAINNLTSNNLSVGQVLQIPEIIEEDVPNENIYIVKSGDTLYSIANKYGMSVQELKDLNKLTSNTLSIGQQLVVSEGNAGTLDTYTVKAGDTLYSIANKYGLTVNELKQLNNLTSDILSIGQVLNISNSNTSLPSNTYIVKSGDSLYSIAKKYGITVDALKNANGKTSNLLSIGEILVIPPTTATTRTYTVKAGDSLWKIATTYGVSVNALKQANGLSSDLLSIGQVLVIP